MKKWGKSVDKNEIKIKNVHHTITPQAPGGAVKPKKGQYPWQGERAKTGNKLHVQFRKDREPLMVLFECGKQICCVRVDLCGVCRFKK